MNAELEADWDEYEEFEEIACPICGSFSPTHIPENGDEECHEQTPLWLYGRYV